MGAGGRAGLTIAGQVVGSYFGPIGSMIGGMLGAALGNALFPEQIDGPKLGDFQMMTSTYGAAIPMIWGGMRVGGNVFWVSAIREVEVTESQGKGGGPEVTYKKRYADIAVGLCAGEIVGIRKLWMNQKLVYDLGDAADISTIYASFAQGGEGMRFYPGSQTQMPDPTIEAGKGVGETPAYRGLAYVVFVNLELGTTFPNITAEVIRGGTTLGPRGIFGIDWDLEYGSSSQVRILSVGGEVIARAEDYRTFASLGDGTDSRIAAPELAGPWPRNRVDVASSGFESLLLWPENELGIYTMTLPASNTSGGRAATSIRQAAMNEDGELEATGANFSSTLMDSGNFIFALIPSVDREHVLALMAEADDGEDPTYWVLWHYADAAFTEVRRGTIPTPLGAYPSGGAMSSQNGGTQVYYAGMLESDLEHFWSVGTAGEKNIKVYEITGEDELLLVAEIEYPDVDPTMFGPVSVYADNACAWVDASGNLFGFTRAPSLAIDLTLDQLVEEICLEAGLAADEIDVTDLEEIEVQGYLLKQQGSARAAIEPLMVAYAFDAVESDDAVKFVRRNSTAAVTIPQDDLGAGQGQAAEAVVETTRAQESELPMLVEVSYMAPHADYQVGTQRVTRGTTESVDKRQFQLPLALSDQEAIEIAYRMQYELWIARNQRSWSTTVKYAAVEPTDVVDLEVA